MERVNLLLNFLGWLLWAAALVFPRYAVRSSQPLTLLSTLRSESPQSYGRFFLLGGLVLLLGLRAVAYWNFASAGETLPSVNFGLVSVSFQTDTISHMIGYSVSSFAVFLFVYYVAIFGLSITCRQRTRVDSIENLVNQQLGAAAYWHPWLKVGAMVGVGACLWLIVGLGLIRIQALPQEWSFGVLLVQSPFVAISLLLSFLYVIVLVIGLYFLNSYVYMGEKVLWKFVDETAAYYLSLMRSVPLLVGRFDFSPLIGIFLYWLFYQLGDWGLRLVFERLPG